MSVGICRIVWRGCFGYLGDILGCLSWQCQREIIICSLFGSSCIILKWRLRAKQRLRGCCNFPVESFPLLIFYLANTIKCFKVESFPYYYVLQKCCKTTKRSKVWASAAISGIIGCVNQTQASPLNFRFPFLTARWKNYNKENWGCGGSIPDICQPRQPRRECKNF